MNKQTNGVTSIANLKNVPSNTQVSVIAMIASVSISPIKKYMVLDIEDNTGRYRALSSVINQEIVDDQVVLISGKKSKDAIFIDEITFPDSLVKDGTDVGITDSYALFLSDIHVGSKLFAKKEFERFIDWLCGREEEYASISKCVKFIVIAGDMIDGIGVYPDQEKELEIKSLAGQYEALYMLLDRIPKHIKILLSQGNHDATHIAEPQPVLDRKFGGSMFNLKNAVFLSNPYQVNLIVGNKKVNLLSYHGFSLMYYVNSIQKYNKMTENDIISIMKLQLKSRHLAPTHGSAQLIPLDRDYLVIDETPDIYVTGHVHKAAAAKYKETLLINASCWQYQTSYQKKYGIEPDIAKVVAVNLRDKTFQILDFMGEKVQISRKGIKEEAI